MQLSDIQFVLADAGCNFSKLPSASVAPKFNPTSKAAAKVIRQEERKGEERKRRRKVVILDEPMVMMMKDGGDEADYLGRRGIKRKQGREKRGFAQGRRKMLLIRTLFLFQ